MENLTNADSPGPVDEFRVIHPEPRAELFALQARDAEVRAHEEAHIRAVGPEFKAEPHYEYVIGPDAKPYAVSGHVDIPADRPDLVSRAALAPAIPSYADREAKHAADVQIIERERETRVEREFRVEQSPRGPADRISTQAAVRMPILPAIGAAASAIGAGALRAAGAAEAVAMAAQNATASVTDKFGRLARKTEELDGAFGRMQNSFEKFSPETISSRVRADISAMQGDIKSAGLVDDSMARFVDNQAEFTAFFTDIKAILTKITLDSLNPIMEGITSLVEFVDPFFDFVVNTIGNGVQAGIVILQVIVDILKEALSWLTGGAVFDMADEALKGVAENLKRIQEAITKLGERDDLGMVDPFLDMFLNMEPAALIASPGAPGPGSRPLTPGTP